MPKALVATTTSTSPRHEAPLRVGARARAPGRRGRRRTSTPSASPELDGQALGVGARAGVDDGRARGGLGQRGDQPPRACRRRCAHGHDGKGEVGAVEAGRNADGFAQPEAAGDVGGHLRRGRRGRGDDASRAEPARGVAQAEVVGAEVVAPLGDAVRLVDDEQADVDLADGLQENGR